MTLIHHPTGFLSGAHFERRVHFADLCFGFSARPIFGGNGAPPIAVGCDRSAGVPWSSTGLSWSRPSREIPPGVEGVARDSLSQYRPVRGQHGSVLTWTTPQANWCPFVFLKHGPEKGTFKKRHIRMAVIGKVIGQSRRLRMFPKLIGLPKAGLDCADAPPLLYPTLGAALA